MKQIATAEIQVDAASYSHQNATVNFKGSSLLIA
jgi:hypothetical protein